MNEAIDQTSESDMELNDPSGDIGSTSFELRLVEKKQLEIFPREV